MSTFELKNAFTRRALLASAAAIGLTVAAGDTAARADATKVTIAYQTVVEPSKIPQADGSYDKAAQATFDWKKFDSGADVITAIASGSVDIGYVGSSPLAAAASRELPVETIFIVGLIGESEAFVVRDGAKIKTPKDLVGKKIAVPFVSTTHYSLLAALKHWGIDPKSVDILNLRPPEIAAAWSRGDIDAAYVWDPALGKIKETGKLLTSSAEVAKWGAPTFDAWIVRKDFAEAHPDIVKSFVRVTGKAYADFHANSKKWNAQSSEAKTIAKLTGAKVDEVPELLRGYHFPLLQEQASSTLLGGGTAKAIAATSAFLKEQGKISAVLPDYSGYVTAKFVTDALASN